MTKRKTVLIVILSLVLAALIAAAGVLGVTLSRSSFSDASTGEAGEARWLIRRAGSESFETDVDIMDTIRPDYKSYEAHIGDGNTQVTPGGGWGYDSADPGIQTDEWEEMGGGTTYTVRVIESFGVFAVLENAGEVAAAVTVTGSGDPTPNRDGCAGYDDYRYTDEEILEHLSFEVYCSDVGTAEMEDIGAETTEKTVQRADGGDGVSFDLPVGGRIYFYLLVTWATDLDEDMFELDDSGNVKTDSNGNKTLNAAYDGTQGDEFDTWAGQHLKSVTLHVDTECVQAE